MAPAKAAGATAEAVEGAGERARAEASKGGKPAERSSPSRLIDRWCSRPCTTRQRLRLPGPRNSQ